MRNMIGSLTVFVFLAGMANCAGAASQVYTWQDVKQEVGPAASKPVSDAYLKVYTENTRVNEGGHTYNIRLPYTIFSADGKKIKWVRNRYTYLVTLPPGKYVIVPDGWENRNQIIGAILEQGKLTEVHMMGG